MSQAKEKKATVSFVAIIDGKFVVYTEGDEVPAKVAKDALATSNNDFAGNHCPRRRRDVLRHSFLSRLSAPTASGGPGGGGLDSERSVGARADRPAGPAARASAQLPAR